MNSAPAEPMTLAELLASGRSTCNVDEAASILSLSRATGYRYARRGELPGVRRLGNRLLVSIPELARYLGADPPGTGDDPGRHAEVADVESSDGDRGNRHV